VQATKTPLKTQPARTGAVMSAFVPADLLARLDERAMSRFTSRSSLVREAIHRYLKDAR
jgi:metal-responsive CopG/Arc/MetJ family transcriptional regulator